MSEFFRYITGSLSWPHVAAGLLFVGMGLMIALLFAVSRRNPGSARTPRRWSWRFFWDDNALRFILNLLTAVALIRFWPDVAGADIGMFHCFCIGLCFDSLYILIREARKRLVGKMENKVSDADDLSGGGSC